MDLTFVLSNLVLENCFTRNAHEIVPGIKKPVNIGM